MNKSETTRLIYLLIVFIAHFSAAVALFLVMQRVGTSLPMIGLSVLAMASLWISWVSFTK